MEALKCSFAVQSITDGVSNVANANFPAGTIVNNLPTFNSQYWLEKDTNGNTHLCTVKTDQAPLDAVFIAPGGPYTSRAVNFEITELVGGRPIHRPHAY